MKTTLQSIKDKQPCSDGWKKLLNHLGKTSADEEPLDFSTILESNGIEDAVWCLCTLPYKDRCLFLMEVAYKVLPLFEERLPEDKRPREALEAVQKYYDGSITEEELKKAAADAAAAAAYAYAAAYAVYAAAYAAAASAAAYASATSVASAYASAATSVAAAASAAAYDAAAYDASAAAAYASAAASAVAASATFWKEEITPLFIKHFTNSKEAPCLKTQ